MAHQFLTYNYTDNEELLRILSVEILNYFSNKNLTRRKWKNIKPFTIRYNIANGTIEKSKPISYHIIYEALKTKLVFDPFEFNLPVMQCHWLDYSLKYNFNFHPQPGFDFIDIKLDSVFGTANPVRYHIVEPTIVVTSMMGTLFKHIIKKRNELVHGSDQLYRLDWLLEFRNIVADAISLVDITFNQLHYKAEYNKLSGWNYDVTQLGDRFGRRLMDKFNWVHKITGGLLPDLAAEKKALENLKYLRNQLMHFDPAHFEIKLKDLSTYFNDIILIGSLIYKVRKTIKAEISSELILFMLQPTVNYNENRELRIAIEY